MNISRPDFCRNIFMNDDNRVAETNKFFDEIMALYNIVSDDYIRVHKIDDSECIAKFTVKFVSSEKAHEIYKCVSYRETVIYGKVVQVVCWETEEPDTLIMSFHQIS